MTVARRHPEICAVQDASGAPVRVPDIDCGPTPDNHWAAHGLVGVVTVLMAVLASVFFGSRLDFARGDLQEHQARMNVERLRKLEPARVGNRRIAQALPTIAYAGETRPTLHRDIYPGARVASAVAGLPLLTVSPSPPHLPTYELKPTRLIAHVRIAPRILFDAVELAAPTRRMSPIAIANLPRRLTLRYLPQRAHSQAHPHIAALNLPRETRVSAITATPPNLKNTVRGLPRLGRPTHLTLRARAVSLRGRVTLAPPPRVAVTAGNPGLKATRFSGSHTPLMNRHKGRAAVRHKLNRLATAPLVAALSLTVPRTFEPQMRNAPPPIANRLERLAIQSLTLETQALTGPPKLRAPARNSNAPAANWLTAMFAPPRPHLDGVSSYNRGRCIAPVNLERVGEPVPPQRARTDLQGDAFGLALAKAANRQRQWITIYSAKYQALPFPGGDLPLLLGSCSDVIIRAYRALGYDLQLEVQAARVGTGDKNIDHRRTNTLRRLFARKGQSFTPSPYPENYKPGDVVTYYRPFSRVSRAHIAIVSHLIAPTGRPYIIHNRGYNVQLEDALFVDRMTGHYRFRPFDGAKPRPTEIPVADAKPTHATTAQRAQQQPNPALKPTYALGAAR